MAVVRSSIRRFTPFDLLRWIVGPVERGRRLQGALRYPHLEGEDTLVASLRFANGALGMIEAANIGQAGLQASPRTEW
jgi:predicted dehydrogenase